VLALILVGVTLTQWLQQPHLSQKIKHATYSLHVPASWTYHLYGDVHDRYSDPTVVLQNAAGKQVGTLLELRIDDENSIATAFQNPIFNGDLSRSKNALIYTGVEKGERYFCDASTGLTLYFKTDLVPYRLANQIVDTWQIGTK
jgi:hypothetical protein